MSTMQKDSDTKCEADIESLRHGDDKISSERMTTVDSVSESISQSHAIDPAVERSLKRKLDTKLLPVLAAMYLFNAIDRSNLGNARTDTLEKDLGMSGNQYLLTLMFFYITFCGLDLPANMLTKKVGPHITLPTMMVGWGTTTILSAAAYNWAGLVACRVFMGAFEAGFMAGIVYFLTTFYRRNELALRICLFYGAATIAGAFSGLLAFGVFQMDHYLAGWKWLFLIEGAATLVLAAFSYFWIPQNIKKCRFFTEEEKTVATIRILIDSSLQAEEKFSFKACKNALLQWRVAVNSVIALSYGIAAATVGNWIPIIVRSLGYSTVKTNLYTVAPYVVGCVVLFALCISSDYFRERSFHLIGAMTLTFTGFVILAAVDPAKHLGVAYFACFLLTSGAFAPSCIFHTWHNNNDATENARSAVTGVMVGAANAGGIVSSLSFQQSTAPRFIPALIAGASFQAFGIFVIFCLATYYRWDNRRRDKLSGRKVRAGDVSTATMTGNISDPLWRWTT